ncbi:MAG TPA: S8 family serine peptidase [Candidatus Limnocylindrales bacterium]|nr:S8 family serine peptidase [Candidatus Limnocylindrales bacterium]
MGIAVHRPNRSRRRLGVVPFAALGAVILAALVPPVTDAGQPIAAVGDGRAVAAGYVVVLAPDASVTGSVRRLARDSVRPDHVFRHALRGFAATLTPAQAAAVRADPSVRAVVPDARVELTEQSVPTGVERIRATDSPIASINGIDGRVNVDVAIIDTGIDPDNPDLNVAGGHNCTGDGRGWGDVMGHGTHVAGTIGARDNGIGVVGVAPGARLWSVRAFEPDGFSRISWIVCAIDWITSLKDPIYPDLPRIEVVNMSLRDDGRDDHDCGRTNHDPEHEAICRSVAAGITYVVAAGNDATTTARWRPASYDEVITVSALADFDGLPGALAEPTCSALGGAATDDAFAPFSNYGADVDLIAPGVCIRSTYPGGSTKLSSGTSMAAPHAAGAAALYKAAHLFASPADVRAALVAAGSADWDTSSDPDGTHEPLVDVAAIAADETAPSVRPPTESVISGRTLHPKQGIPVRTRWNESDAGSGLASQALRRSLDGGAWKPVATDPSDRTTTAVLPFGHRLRHEISVADRAGNRTAPADGPTVKAVGHGEGDATFHRRWSTRWSGYAWGGRFRHTTTRGASATFRVAARAVAIVAYVGRGRGGADVYVDGVHVGAIHTYARSAAARRIVWAHRFATPGTHVVRLVNRATAGHPALDLDGLLALR